MMFAPLSALSLVAQLIVVADQVPKLDVTPSCRGAAAAGYIQQGVERLQTCINSENRTRDDLATKWATFPAADRAYCVATVKGFSPTYTELATCLEMQQYAREAKKNGPDLKPLPARRR